MDSTQSCNETKAALKRVAGLGMVAVALLIGSEGAIAQDIHAPASTPQTLAQLSTPITGYFLFVNPTIGNDTGDGSQRFPLRTITRALQLAQPNTVVVLNAGTYSVETGEAFPLVLKPGVTLQGDAASRGRGILIRGGGEFVSPTSARQNVTLLGANQSFISGVTITNPNPRGYALWIESSSPTVTASTFSNSTHDGISVVGHGAPLIQGNVFVQNGANGITVFGTAQPQIRDNLFERTGFGINIAQQAAPAVINNRIVNNEDGIVVQGDARPVLRGNTIEGNERDGLVAIARSVPNLGTTTEPGQNIFRNNGRYDLNTSATNQTIAAWGNELASNRIHGSVNLSGQAIASRPTNPSTSVRPTASTSAPVAMVTRPTNPSGSFAALPSLQPAAPIPIPVQPAQGTTQPTRPERLPLLTQTGLSSSRSTNPTTPTSSAFPSPTGLASTATTTPGAIEIPVPPPAVGGGRPPIVNPTSPNQLSTNSTAIASPSAIAIAPANGVRSTTPVREVAVQRSTPSSATTAIPSASSTRAIEIPVPPPQSTQVAASPLPQQTPSRVRTSTPTSSPNVLPVPNGNVPVGNIGDMPTVLVSRDPLQRRATVPLPSNHAVALGLRYRVVVEAEDETTQAMVRSLIPGAFRTQANGRIMMQAGAYSDRANADQTVQWLTGNGLRAMVQPLN
ncbi:DUF1565 domain-containing protein [Oscillatoria sp. FACHB-1407]|uniref:DUF1565 domain-containing protein n=1 Tax=Oscillatoria sp. FACHB-1407 TaxID=2692847 RepID=UPI001684CADB|nr:DUF1565 domain-containing protein [Oscillatoria sp. FACHB-1407]MBD2464204.1 DUF1565 domain-containing protein [Oscillatoria sp. FACHB-1407]